MNTDRGVDRRRERKLESVLQQKISEESFTNRKRCVVIGNCMMVFDSAGKVYAYHVKP